MSRRLDRIRRYEHDEIDAPAEEEYVVKSDLDSLKAEIEKKYGPVVDPKKVDEAIKAIDELKAQSKQNTEEIASLKKEVKEIKVLAAATTATPATPAAPATPVAPATQASAPGNGLQPDVTFSISQRYVSGGYASEDPDDAMQAGGEEAKKKRVFRYPDGTYSPLSKEELEKFQFVTKL